MEEEDNIIVRWAQEDVEASYNLLNKNKNHEASHYVIFSILLLFSRSWTRIPNTDRPMPFVLKQKHVCAVGYTENTGRIIRSLLL